MRQQKTLGYHLGIRAEWEKNSDEDDQDQRDYQGCQLHHNEIKESDR